MNFHGKTGKESEKVMSRKGRNQEGREDLHPTVLVDESRLGYGTCPSKPP